MASKVQITLNGKAADLWDLVPRRSRTLAIEQALLKLAQDEPLSAIFFQDKESVASILNNKETPITPKEGKEDTTAKAKKNSDKSSSNKNSVNQVETAWG